MIKIGDFARLSQVTIATLRHYDERGLLSPLNVDQDSNYRYYSVTQLPRLNRILALRDLGFSLEQILEVLQDDVSPEQLRGMFKLRQVEAAERLAAEQRRLERLEVRLRWIEQENCMPMFEIVLKTVPSMLVAARRISIPTNDQVPAYLNPAFQEVFEHADRHGAKKHGPHLALWYTSASTLADEDAEAMLPIDRSIPSSDRVNVYTLPQVEVASVIHHGEFQEFTQGHTALLQWIEQHHYEITGPFREIYLAHNPNDLADSTTEIQYPVQKAQG